MIVFPSQDTVVALQALAAYSKQTAGNSLDLRVKLTSEVDLDWKPPEVHITPDNALLRRDFDVSQEKKSTCICGIR